jgi:carboxypeptidase Q
MSSRAWTLGIGAFACVALGFTCHLAAADDATSRILGTALVDGGAYEKLAYLSDRIGHRFSGSTALDEAVAWTAAEFRRDGIEHVWTQPVMVPRWIRGEEHAGIVAPIEREMALLALGGSVGTAPEGVTAEVIEANSFEELEELGERVRGKIVLFNKPMETASDYGTGSTIRYRGASKAARLGAVGMLLRSLGTADFRLPHTGSMRYEEDAPQIPAAAISVEDAALIQRLRASGDAVRVHLKLGSHTLDDVESANVIADLRGRELPDEIVLIGAHLDSWDVGQGAHDDGAGCAIVMETMSLLERLELVPKRTIRAVLFTNEENGLRGGKAYAAEYGEALHVAAIESDIGGAAPRGFGVSAGPGGVEMIRALISPLAVIDADAVEDGGGGADISPLKKLGVPVLHIRQDSTHYFDYHHTEADTLDKVKAKDLDRNVAALALLAFALAERDDTLPRLETTEE